MRNIGGMMKRVQEMQEKMQEMTAEMEASRFDCSVGGGAVVEPRPNRNADGLVVEVFGRRGRTEAYGE